MSNWIYNISPHNIFFSILNIFIKGLIFILNNIKKIIKFQIISFFIVSIAGTLLHFTFDWFDENRIIAAFSSVNESTWEHLKLVFYPMLIMTIIGYFYLGKNIQNFLCAKSLGIIYAISFIVIFFYTYTGIIGNNFAILDIGSFFVAVFIGEYVAFKKMLSFDECKKTVPIITLVVLLLCFILFTYFPPKINLFRDPVYDEYGIISKK